MARMRRGILGFVQGSFDGLTGRIVRNQNVISRKGDWSHRVFSQAQIDQQMKMRSVMALFGPEWHKFNTFVGTYAPITIDEWLPFFRYWYPVAQASGNVGFTTQYWAEGIRKPVTITGTPVYHSNGNLVLTWSSSIAGGNAAFSDLCDFGIYSRVDGRFEAFKDFRTRGNAGANQIFRPLPIGTEVVLIVSMFDALSRVCSNASFFNITVTA